MKTLIALVMLTALTTTAAGAQQMAAQATLVDASGKRIGTANLTETPGSGVLVQVTIQEVPEGPHALHIHEVGACTPDFEAAGGHFAPEGDTHGYLAQGGEHAGDLPNIHVPNTGSIVVEKLAPDVTLAKGDEASLMDADGSALVLHERPDDYTTQPAGAAGDRIACGVIER